MALSGVKRFNQRKCHEVNRPHETTNMGSYYSPLIRPPQQRPLRVSLNNRMSIRPIQSILNFPVNIPAALRPHPRRHTPSSVPLGGGAGARPPLRPPNFGGGGPSRPFCSPWEGLGRVALEARKAERNMQEGWVLEHKTARAGEVLWMCWQVRWAILEWEASTCLF